MQTAAKSPEYDAFGDPVSTPRVTSSKLARRVTVVMFWSVATLLIVGRIHQHGSIIGPQTHTMELASR